MVVKKPVQKKDPEFEAWMEEVDACVLATAEVSVHDLADASFRDWFDDGMSPEEAAGLVLEENDFDV